MRWVGVHLAALLAATEVSLCRAVTAGANGQPVVSKFGAGSAVVGPSEIRVDAHDLGTGGSAGALDLETNVRIDGVPEGADRPAAAILNSAVAEPVPDRSDTGLELDHSLSSTRLDRVPADDRRPGANHATENEAPPPEHDQSVFETLETVEGTFRKNGAPTATHYFDRRRPGPAAADDADLPAVRAGRFIDWLLGRVRDVSLRDGPQSLDGNRWLIGERLPIAEGLDKLGLHSVESGGGADYEVHIGRLGENPFENLRRLGRALAQTLQQWLFRGRNALGLGLQPRDVIKAMVAHAIRHGVQWIRVFDGMNDVKNIGDTVKAVLDARRRAPAGAHVPRVEGALAYTVDPPGTPTDRAVWTVDAFIELALAMKKMGVDAIAIKDMAGVLTEEAVDVLVRRLHAEVGLPISVHSHSSTGRAVGVLRKALQTAREIGAELLIDTAIGDLSGGTSHPDLRGILRAELEDAGFKPEDYEDNPKVRLLEETEALIARTAERFKADRVPVDAEMSALLDASGIPGGMIGTTANMLRPQLPGFREKLKQRKVDVPDLTITELIKEALRRVPAVRQDAGLPPLVTPMSQFVLMQAVFNYVYGDYVRLHPHFAAMMKGRFGMVRGQRNMELLERILKEDMLRQVSVEERAGEAPAGTAAWLAATIRPPLNFNLGQVRRAVRLALKDKVDKKVLARIMREGKAGPSEPLAPALPRLMEEARRLAFRYALDVADPLELALLLVTRGAEELLSAPPALSMEIVGTRADGFPRVRPRWSRSNIVRALGNLPEIIARGGEEATIARTEANRILVEVVMLEDRALLMGEFILEELVDEARASRGT